MRQRTDYDTQL